MNISHDITRQISSNRDQRQIKGAQLSANLSKSVAVRSVATKENAAARRTKDGPADEELDWTRLICPVDGSTQKNRHRRTGLS